MLQNKTIELLAVNIHYPSKSGENNPESKAASSSVLESRASSSVSADQAAAPQGLRSVAAFQNLGAMLLPQGHGCQQVGLEDRAPSRR